MDAPSWRLAHEERVMVRIVRSTVNVEKCPYIGPLTVNIGIKDVRRNQIECADVEVK